MPHKRVIRVISYEGNAEVKKRKKKKIVRRRRKGNPGHKCWGVQWGSEVVCGGCMKVMYA